MHILKLIRGFLKQQIVRLSPDSILLCLVIYFVVSWLLLWLCGEEALLNLPDYIYWMLVTGSTVGYGDLSPTTAAGKLVVALFVIPVGLGIFASMIGWIANYVTEQWKKGVRGLNTLDVTNHIIVIGWNGNRTIHLLGLLLSEQALSTENRPIVLVSLEEIENPLPGRIGFVRARSYHDEEAMRRAAIATARCIIVDEPEDSVTMTTALFCEAQNPSAHILAYFRDENLSVLLKKHCPSIECTPSVSVELLAKSAFDPGSSALHLDLLSAANREAQYSIEYPTAAESVSVEKVFMTFKTRYGATLIGMRAPNNEDIDLNPDLGATITPGSILYYIADGRLTGVDWRF